MGSSLYDASLIATPTGDPIPTGTYALPLGLPHATQSVCLDIPEQRPAWNCDMAGDADLAINVGSAPDGRPGAFLYSIADDSQQLCYGTQTSNMQTIFSPFVFVKDNEDPNNGPAIYFQQSYNKLVVIPGSALDATTQKIKRDYYDIPSSWLQQKQIATPGDQPWFCYWNETLMEGFIYTNKRVIASSTSSSSITPTADSMRTTASSTTPTAASASATPDMTSMTWDPSATVSTTLTMPSTTCTYSGVASSYIPWLQANYPNYKGDGDGDGNDGPDSQKRDSNYAYPGDDSLPIYPYLVKIEERRIQASPQAYCAKAQVLNDYTWNWVTDNNGQQIVVPLQESDPNYGAYQSAGIAGTRRLRQRQTLPQGCHCQWLNGQS